MAGPDFPAIIQHVWEHLWNKKYSAHKFFFFKCNKIFMNAYLTIIEVDIILHFEHLIKH